MGGNSQQFQFKPTSFNKNAHKRTGINRILHNFFVIQYTFHSFSSSPFSSLSVDPTDYRMCLCAGRMSEPWLLLFVRYDGKVLSLCSLTPDTNIVPFPHLVPFPLLFVHFETATLRGRSCLKSHEKVSEYMITFFLLFSPYNSSYGCSKKDLLVRVSI